MHETAIVIDAAEHKLSLAAASGTKAPPAAELDGASTSPWASGGVRPRRCVLRFTAAAALNLTAISLWGFYAGAWSKLSTIPDITFAAGDLSRTVVVEFPIGSRLAAAFTVSASNVTVEAFPLESHVC